MRGDRCSAAVRVFEISLKIAHGGSRRGQLPETRSSCLGDDANTASNRCSAHCDLTRGPSDALMVYRNYSLMGGEAPSLQADRRRLAFRRLGCRKTRLLTLPCLLRLPCRRPFSHLSLSLAGSRCRRLCLCARARALATCPGASLAAARALRCALPTCFLGTHRSWRLKLKQHNNKSATVPPAPPPHCSPLFVHAFVRSQVGIFELPSAWPARVRRQASFKLCSWRYEAPNSSRLVFWGGISGVSSSALYGGSRAREVYSGSWSGDRCRRARLISSPAASYRSSRTSS